MKPKLFALSLAALSMLATPATAATAAMASGSGQAWSPSSAQVENAQFDPRGRRHRDRDRDRGWDRRDCHRNPEIHRGVRGMHRHAGRSCRVVRLRPQPRGPRNDQYCIVIGVVRFCDDFR